MGTYNYYGKDGTGYNTWDEMRKADKRWEQQEKQNRLLEEQNKLIREQQEREEFHARMERNRIAYQQRYEEFENNWQTDIFPLMQKAGIKDPVAYLEKLRELYNDKPEKAEELKLLDKTNIRKWNKISNYPTNISNELLKIYNPSANKIVIIISLIIFSIVGLCMFDGDFTSLVVIAICFLFILGTTLFFMNYDPKKKREMNQKIELVNNEIKKYNEQSNKEIQQWESKIKNYEKKRLKNFNLFLEIALEKLSIAESELEEYDINYRLQFNDYPSDYEKNKKEYFNKINANKAKKDGTEVFLDL